MMSPTRRLSSHRSNAALFCSFLLPVLFPIVAPAQFAFITNNGAITITGYSGVSNVVIIPSTTNGLPVTSIGNSAFYGYAIVSVAIPNSITNIGNSAFESCGSQCHVRHRPNQYWKQCI